MVTSIGPTTRESGPSFGLLVLWQFPIADKRPCIHARSVCRLTHHGLEILGAGRLWPKQDVRQTWSSLSESRAPKAH